MSMARNEVTSAQLDAAAQTFDLLSVPGRLHLVWLLASRELDVTTLAELSGASIPAASQQLASCGPRRGIRPLGRSPPALPRR